MCPLFVCQVRIYWNIKWGQFYKGSKEVPAKDLKECTDACLNADKCFVLSWADDKCFIQDDGESELKPENLEPRSGVFTLLGKKKGLFMWFHGSYKNIADDKVI